LPLELGIWARNGVKCVSPVVIIQLRYSTNKPTAEKYITNSTNKPTAEKYRTNSTNKPTAEKYYGHCRFIDGIGSIFFKL
jgi:hypothetical protein